jgi:hypothetical protein
MKKNLHFMTTIFSLIVLTIASALWLQIAIGSTWQGPGANPPDDNVAAPLNIGSQYQSKAGGLDVDKLYLQNKNTKIVFSSIGPALAFDATNNNDWDMLLYEHGLHMGSGENFYLNNGEIYDDHDNTVDIGENLAVAGNSLTVSGSEVCRQDGINCPSVSDANNYVTGINFNTGNGILTLNRQGLSNLTEDLDGRYLTNYTETDPQVGNLNNGDWCIANNGQVVCNQPAPSGGGGGDITGVYSGEGTKGGSSSGDVTIEFDCSEVDGTGLACSGEDMYVKTAYRGAEARCSDNKFLDGDGDCRTAAQIVSDGGGGSSGCSNAYKYIQTDNGKATAAGCTDTLGIRGGNGISTSRLGDDVYIEASGSGSSGSLVCSTEFYNISPWTGSWTDTKYCPAGYTRTSCSIVSCKNGAKPDDTGCKFKNPCSTNGSAYMICCKVS